MAYSFTDVVGEAGLSGPRWKLQLVKLAQHAAAAYAVLCLFETTPVVAGLVGGVGVYGGLVGYKLYKTYKTRVPLNWPDLVNDLAFALATTAGGYVAMHTWAPGLLLLGAAAVDYLWLHKRASP